jgi:luciferase-type oxidoreductase
MPVSSSIADRVLAPGRLSIGLTLPVVVSGQNVVDFAEQIELARLADRSGFRALWVRDVPLNSTDYPDPVGHLDPWVLLGALAVNTQDIALASGAIVLTLRHPLHIAKAAISVNTLSNKRFLLGLGSGDRPPEYAAFGRESDDRRELYRHHWEIVEAAVNVPSRVIPERSPPFYLLPQQSASIPMLAVGSGGQSVDWIARHSLGWMTYHREPQAQRGRYSMWRAAVDRVAPNTFRAFGVAMRLDLTDDPDEPASELPLGYRAGRRALIALLHEMRDAGTHHATLNISSDTRAARDIIAEIAEHVLPHFHR